jgi:hypothetical protein
MASNVEPTLSGRSGKARVLMAHDQKAGTALGDVLIVRYARETPQAVSTQQFQRTEGAAQRAAVFIVEQLTNPYA